MCICEHRSNRLACVIIENLNFLRLCIRVHICSQMCAHVNKHKSFIEDDIIFKKFISLLYRPRNIDQVI